MAMKSNDNEFRLLRKFQAADIPHGGIGKGIFVIFYFDTGDQYISIFLRIRRMLDG